MNTAQHNNIVSFIWSIADDCLRDVYVRGKYRDVILPMVVLRRLDAILEESKNEVLKEVQFQLQEVGSTKLDIYKILKITKHTFANISLWTLQKLYDTAIENKPNSKSEDDFWKELEENFYDYLNGFTPDVKDIIDRFKLRAQVRHMADKRVLLDVLEKFTSPYINLTNKEKEDPEGRTMPALSNLGMGYVFEELIRKFNEENNEEAGEHFTPREVIDLMTHLVFEPIKDVLPTNISIYDPACGSGGMLTESKDFVQRRYKSVKTVELYGVEINDETYAICQSDMMIKGNTGHIVCGSTISKDNFEGHAFNFSLSNPPYGKSWASEMKNVFGEKNEILDPRFKYRLADLSGLVDVVGATPRSSDGQLLFLMEMIDKMALISETNCGSRIATVHNGSSLFTGDAGSGESNCRRHIIENDLLEAIIQLPNNIFYNTGISTYIWLLTNNKTANRKGKVQLIDASEAYEKLRKNLGSKNCQFSQNDIKQIMECYNSMNNKGKDKTKKVVSLVLDNNEFGYYKVPIERPKRLAVQFTDIAIEELRFDKSVIRPMKWAYSQFGDDLYTNLEKYTANIEQWCKRNGIDLTTKTKSTLFGLSTWNKGRTLIEIASKLMRKIGEDRWMNYNEFIEKFEKTLREEKMKLSNGDKKAILGAISKYDSQAEKVIKKKHTEFTVEKLKVLTDKFKCKIGNLPDYGYYPTNDPKIWIEYESENELRDFENIPLEDNIYNYFLQEVKPYVSEAWINFDAIKIGYEILFNKYFYSYTPLRSLDDITSDIQTVEQATKGLINQIIKM